MSYTQYKRSGGYGRNQHTSRPRQVQRGPKKEYINPARFIQSAKQISEAEYTPKHSFADFDIQPLLRSNLMNMGFSKLRRSKTRPYRSAYSVRTLSVSPTPARVKPLPLPCRSLTA